MAVRKVRCRRKRNADQSRKQLIRLFERRIFLFWLGIFQASGAQPHAPSQCIRSSSSIALQVELSRRQKSKDCYSSRNGKRWYSGVQSATVVLSIRGGGDQIVRAGGVTEKPFCSLHTVCQVDCLRRLKQSFLDRSVFHVASGCASGRSAKSSTFGGYYLSTKF